MIVARFQINESKFSVSGGLIRLTGAPLRSNLYRKYREMQQPGEIYRGLSI